MIRRPFDDLLREALRTSDLPIQSGPAALAAIPYDQEYDVKRRVVANFLTETLGSSVPVEPLFRAPLPRGYRSTSRRRIWIDKRGRTNMVHGDGSSDDVHVSTESLEPDVHAAIYRRMQTWIDDPRQPIGKMVNHIIIRGTYEQQILILNVRYIDADVVRAARRCAETIQKEIPSVVGAWMFVDPTSSKYYLELERPAKGVGAKKFFGEAVWRQRVGAIGYQVGVFSFSQINLAMLPTFVERITDAMQVKPADVVADLYCGYGLFGAAVAKSAKSVVAIDVDETSVDNARYNIQRAGGTMYGGAHPITARSIRQRLLSADVVVLDPPRKGTEPGVIDAVAERRPRRVVEVFCAPDEIRRSVREWRQAGYDVERAIPFDFFPGTFGLEVALVLTPGDVPAPEPSQRPRRTDGPRPRSKNR